MNKKKPSSIFKIIFLSLFVYFLSFYHSSQNGYYFQEQNKIKVYTEEQIKKFEEDVKNNKEIDLENYLQYENKIEKNGHRLGLKISESIEKYAKKGIEKALRMLNNVVDK